MSEYRFESIADWWVIIAEERANRPHSSSLAAKPGTGVEDCPFCEGHEHETPPEILADRKPGDLANQPGWRMRVFPNLYPAARPDIRLKNSSQIFTARQTGFGHHYVIVESWRHVRGFGQMTLAETKRAFRVYRELFLMVKNDITINQVVVFKNVGAIAGASLEHTHSQMVALPHVPREVRVRNEGTLRYFRETGQTKWEIIIQEEQKKGDCVVVDQDRLFAYCPYASRFPYEVWIVPKLDIPGFEESSLRLLDEAATLTRRIVRALEAHLDNPAYNFVVESLPFDHYGSGRDHGRWFISILPRLNHQGGLECAMGEYINVIAPENAAAHIRRCLES